MKNLDEFVKQIAGNALESVFGGSRTDVHWTHAKDPRFPTIVCTQVGEHAEDGRQTARQYLFAIYSGHPRQLAKLEDSCLDQLETKDAYDVDAYDDEHDKYKTKYITESEWPSDGSKPFEVYGRLLTFTLRNDICTSSTVVDARDEKYVPSECSATSMEIQRYSQSGGQPVTVAVLTREVDGTHWRTKQDYTTHVEGLGTIYVPMDFWSSSTQCAREKVHMYINGWLEGRRQYAKALQVKVAEFLPVD